VDNVSGVFLDGEAVSNHDLAEVCPQQDTTYTLRVVYPDGRETVHTMTITAGKP
jgi:hypothetical protein